MTSSQNCSCLYMGFVLTVFLDISSNSLSQSFIQLKSFLSKAFTFSQFSLFSREPQRQNCSTWQFFNCCDTSSTVGQQITILSNSSIAQMSLLLYFRRSFSEVKQGTRWSIRVFGLVLLQVVQAGFAFFGLSSELKMSSVMTIPMQLSTLFNTWISFGILSRLLYIRQRVKWVTVWAMTFRCFMHSFESLFKQSSPQLSPLFQLRYSRQFWQKTHDFSASLILISQGLKGASVLTKGLILLFFSAFLVSSSSSNKSS